jgi:hypothetical protein
MEIKKEDIEIYEIEIENFKKQFEKENEGRIFKPVFNKRVLESITRARAQAEEQEKDYEKKLDEFVMAIDPKVKTELDLRLAKGEISHDEYEKVIRTLVWTNKAHLPPSFRRHLQNTGPKDPHLKAAEREVAIRLQQKDRERIERGEQELETCDSEVQEESPKSELEKAAESIENKKASIENEKVSAIEQKINDSIEETDNEIIINSGIQLTSLLKTETENLSGEAMVVLQNIRQAYASINQGCGCTKNKRADIAFQNFKRNITDLGKDLGIISLVKKVSGKDKVVFTDLKGEVFLEA